MLRTYDDWKATEPPSGHEWPAEPTAEDTRNDQVDALQQRGLAFPLPGLVIPADVPDHARQVLAHFDAGYTRAAEIAAADPGEMRRHAKTMREAGMGWAAEQIEARARIVELDPRLEIAGSGIVQLEATGADATTLSLLRTYVDLIQAQAEARRVRRAAA